MLSRQLWRGRGLGPGDDLQLFKLPSVAACPLAVGPRSDVVSCVAHLIRIRHQGGLEIPTRLFSRRAYRGVAAWQGGGEVEYGLHNLP